MAKSYNTDPSPEGELPKEKQKELELLQNFAQNTTMHGLHCVANSQTKVTKGVWLILVALSLMYMIKSTILSGKRYLSYPYTTEIGDEFSGLKFPAITICPQNMFPKKKIELPDFHPLFHKMKLNLQICEDTRESRKRYNLPCGMFLMCNLGFYSMGGRNCGPETKIILDNYLSNAKNSTAINYQEEFRDVYGPDLEHSLLECSYFNGKCNASQFTKHTYPYGTCFKINDKKQSASWTLFASGKLFIVLDAKVDQYTESPFFTEGFKIYLQDQGTYTSPTKGFVVSPGNIANVVVKQTKVFRSFHDNTSFFCQKTYLKHPYKSNCTERGLKNFRTYTIVGCLYECFEDLKIKTCGCRSCGYLQNNSQVRVCTGNDAMCERNIKMFQFNPKNCDCRPPCSETSYDYQLSYSTFPDRRSMTMLREKLGIPTVYQRENFVGILINFESSSYSTQNEKASYTWEALLGELGGNLGLMIGCSVLTAAEFLHLFVLLIYRGFQRFSRKRKVTWSTEREQTTT